MHNTDQLEDEVLACFLSDPDEMREIESEITPTLFFTLINKEISRVIVENRKNRIANTLGTIQTKFYENNPNDELKTEFNHKIKALTKLDINIDNIKSMISKLKEYSFRNYCEQAGTKIKALAKTEKVQDIQKEIQGILQKAYMYGRNDSIIKTTHTINDEILSPISNEIPNLTGYIIDNETEGFYGGELIAIGGGTGGRKSTLALNLIDNITRISVENKNPITGALFFSIEMSYKEVVSRMLARRTKIEYKRIARNKFDDNEKLSIIKERDLLEKQNIFVDSDRNTIDDIEAKTRTHMLRYPYTVLVVDYIQIISTTNNMQRHQELGNIATRLKMLSKELKITVVILTQLTEKNGQLVTRDAAEIEHHCDYVFFLQKLNNNEHFLELSCKKARSGDITKLKTIFAKNDGTFNLIEQNKDIIVDPVKGTSKNYGQQNTEQYNNSDIDDIDIDF